MPVKTKFKTKKVTINDQVPVSDETDPVEPKKKGRAKKQPPTKEETLKILSDATSQVKKMIEELKEDELKLALIQLKQVPDLLKEELKNLEEDLVELEENYKELSQAE